MSFDIYDDCDRILLLEGPLCFPLRVPSGDAGVDSSIRPFAFRRATRGRFVSLVLFVKTIWPFAFQRATRGQLGFQLVLFF